MNIQRTLRLSAAVLVTAAGLVACGGGGDGGFRGFPIATTPPPTTTNPPSTPPPAATDPFDAFIAYVKGLVDQLLDTSEPADVAAFDPPPTSETKEPIAVQ